MAYDKLQVLRVPPTWQHQIDLACLSIRSKAYCDQELLGEAKAFEMNQNKTYIHMVKDSSKHYIRQDMIGSGSI